MIPDAETGGLMPSARDGCAEAAIREKASNAAAQIWVKQLGIRGSWLWVQCEWASAGADAARFVVRRAARAAPSTSEQAMPATQAGQPRRSKTWPSTALPTRPPRK